MDMLKGAKQMRHPEAKEETGVRAYLNRSLRPRLSTPKPKEAMRKDWWQLPLHVSLGEILQMRKEITFRC